MLRFPCPHCKTSLKAPPEAAGKTTKCIGCGHRFEVPAKQEPKSTSVPPIQTGYADELTCQDCGETFGLRSDEIGTGRPIHCPLCGQHYTGRSNRPSPRRETSPRPQVDPLGFDPGAQDASIIPTDLTAPERSLAGFWIGTGVVLVLMMLGIGILKSGLLQPNQPQAQRDKTGKEDVSLVVNRPPAKAPSTELQGNTTADEESRRKREEEQAILKAIEKATVLQVSPVRGRAVAEGADDFLSSMRKLADNEFEFLNAKKNVYRSTFNQKEQDVIPKVCVHARNAIVSPGMYDFDEGVYSLPLFFWYSYHEESKGVQGNLLPETLDYVGVVVSLNVEKQVAEKIRNAFDRKKLAVTIWYRLKKVEKASWKANPHWLDGRLAHAIQFEVEILRFTYILDE